MSQGSETFDRGLKSRVFLFNREERCSSSFVGGRLLPSNDPTVDSFRIGVSNFFTGAGEAKLLVTL